MARPESISILCGGLGINLVNNAALILLISIVAAIFLIIFHLKINIKIHALEEKEKQASKSLLDNLVRLSFEQGRVSAILSSMSEGVLAVDQHGRIILANPAIERMFGMIELDVLGKTVREAILNNDITEFIIDEALKYSQFIEREIEIITPIKGTFTAHASPIKDKDGNILGVVCVLHDITELRKLERHRSEFVANVSHELKTPLTAIRSYVETLVLGGINDKENNVKFLEKIDKHAKNLSSLIDDILEISRLESGKELGPFAQINLSEIVEHAVETVSEKAKKKGIKLGHSCKGQNFTIKGIEDHVYRAILNLLENAVNYTDPNGSVSISCIEENGCIKISVSDTGIGIGEGHLPRLFERFYRTDAARSRELGGTGLGLAIVKHVMNIHNGMVSVESELGKGSTFTLVFASK